MGQNRESRYIDRENIRITTIVSAIAEAANVNSTELSVPLNTVIDTDALVQLLSDAENTTHVTFRYQQWLVKVQGDGVVEVTNPSGEE